MVFVMRQTDIFIIGCGAAGMAAALAASGKGASVTVAEREAAPGGILEQCVHRGFGLGYFGEDLTGREYSARFRAMLGRSGVTVLTDTTVLSVDSARTALCSSPRGMERIAFSQCILASGCRERTIGSLPVGGTRPAGVFTAGAAQRMMNSDGYDIGRRAVILGSGDMGLILARRLILRGCRVEAMVELADRPGGLARNRRECFDPYGYPLLLHSTVERVHGEGRVSGVTVRHTDSEEREFIACDTLITAIGLIPERETVRALIGGGAPPWLHLCGNCDYVHDFVDSVSQHAESLGTRLGDIIGRNGV